MTDTKRNKNDPKTFQFTLNSRGPPSQCRPTADHCRWRPGGLRSDSPSPTPPHTPTPVSSLLLKNNPSPEPRPVKQMTVQRGHQPLAWHKVRGNDCESAKKQDGLSAGGARGGKRRTAATFGRVMSSLARQPGENIEGVACFLRIFLSPSLSRERGTLASPRLAATAPPSLSLPSSWPSPPPLPAEMCDSVWKANFHHSAHEYWTASSSFD